MAWASRYTTVCAHASLLYIYIFTTVCTCFSFIIFYLFFLSTLLHRTRTYLKLRHRATLTHLGCLPRSSAPCVVVSSLLHPRRRQHPIYMTKNNRRLPQQNLPNCSNFQSFFFRFLPAVPGGHQAIMYSRLFPRGLVEGADGVAKTVGEGLHFR